MDDPAADCCQRDTAEARACIWARWGFRYVDISYVQPALDAQKARVGHLKLLAKRSALPLVSDIAGTVLISVLHEYLRLAMGIDNPPDSAEFRRMGEAISLRDRIPLLPIIA
jgi:hypothetical protein